MLDNLSINYCGDMTIRYMYFETGDLFDFRERMLSANSIDGHLSLSVQHNSEGKMFLYDISSQKSLREYLQERNADTDLLKSLLSDMERAFVSGKSYMLDENDYCIHPDTLYFDMDGRASLCYLPGYERDIHEQLCSLFEFIMDRVDMNDKRSVYAAYRITSTIKEENCTFQSLLQILREGENDSISNYRPLETSGIDEEMIRSGTLLRPEGGREHYKETNDFSSDIENKPSRGRKENLKKEQSEASGYGNNALIGYAVAIVSFVLVIIYFIFA